MDTTPLSQKHCVPCEGGTKPLSPDEYGAILRTLSGWTDVDKAKIEKTFKFKDFKKALDFVNKVGEIAETEQHHPNIYLFGFNKVKITLTTHAIKGLSENDFILASKIEETQ